MGYYLDFIYDTSNDLLFLGTNSGRHYRVAIREDPIVRTDARFPDSNPSVPDFGTALTGLVTILDKHASFIDFKTIHLRAKGLNTREKWTVEKLLDLYIKAQPQKVDAAVETHSR